MSSHFPNTENASTNATEHETVFEIVNENIGNHETVEIDSEHEIEDGIDCEEDEPKTQYMYDSEDEEIGFQKITTQDAGDNGDEETEGHNGEAEFRREYELELSSDESEYE